MTDEQRSARKEQRKARAKEWAFYMKKKKQSEGSLTVDTLALANVSLTWRCSGCQLKVTSVVGSTALTTF